MVPRGGIEPPTLRFSASLDKLSCQQMKQHPFSQTFVNADIFDI